MSTIQEVAKRVGVSAGTVSRYLNGYQLKAANQNRVEAAIEELGYRSNYLARSLRSIRSMSIGLLINNMLDHFAVSVVAQVERKMELNDYNIILSGFREDRDVFVRKLENLIDRCVDGLILCEPIEDERARQVDSLDEVAAGRAHVGDDLEAGHLDLVHLVEEVQRVEHDGHTEDDGLVDVEHAHGSGQLGDGLGILTLGEEEDGDDQAYRAEVTRLEMAVNRRPT